MFENLPTFILAVLAIAILPGPDMLYVMSQSINHGKRIGIIAALGISSGCMVHTFAVSVGLTALLLESALMFTTVKYLGAVYLLYLGIVALLSKTPIHVNNTNSSQEASATSWQKAYLQGFIIDVLNPKVALFFLAFLPQFAVPTSPHPIWLQMLFLGIIFICIGTMVNTIVACFFVSAKKWFSSNSIALKIQKKITGLILIGLGAQLALFEKD